MASEAKIIGYNEEVGIKKIPAHRYSLISLKPELTTELQEGDLEKIKNKFILDIYSKESSTTHYHFKDLTPAYATDESVVFKVPPFSESKVLAEDKYQKTKAPAAESEVFPDAVFVEISFNEAIKESGKSIQRKRRLFKDIFELEKSRTFEPADIYNLGKELVEVLSKDKQTDVTVLRSQQNKSELLPLFRNIQASIKRISFDSYNNFIDLIFFQKPLTAFENGRSKVAGLQERRQLPFHGVDGYRVLKVASEAFLMAYTGITLDNEIFLDNAQIGSDISAKGLNFSLKDPRSFAKIWTDYIIPDSDKLAALDEGIDLKVLPYLYLIRQKFSDLAIKDNYFNDILGSIADGDSPEAARNCFGIIQERLTNPILLELIWSYWNEEGMLVQTVNAIGRRFQNMKGTGAKDPLAEMEITHLRPLNNILWGYIQDEQHRLSVMRRAYEYDHHYGFTLKGRAVENLQSADSRTRFLEAFHNLLRISSKYYVDSANRLVDPDPFPILNSLREIHFIISEGMHNQYGDMPTVARSEMLMQQWILARPELREFLPGRAAVPYPEPWMDRVASMCKLQGWTDTSPVHFHYLANFGEQLFLSIRFGNWSDQTRVAEDAAQWALFFREVVQGYIHSYKAATGVDLTVALVGNNVDARPPSFHLAQRLKAKQNGILPKPSQPGVPIKSKVKKDVF